MKILIITPVPLDGQNTHMGGGVSFTYMNMIKSLKKKGYEVRSLSPWHNLSPQFDRIYPGFRDIEPSAENLDRIRASIIWADRVIMTDTFAAAKVLEICEQENTPSLLTNHTDYVKLVDATVRKRFPLPVYWLVKHFLSPLAVMRMRYLAEACSCSLVTTEANKRNLNDHGVPVDGIFNNVVEKSAVFTQPDPPEKVAKLRREILAGTKFNKILIHAGRIADEKRIPLLVKARPPKAMLLIIGDGPQAKEISKLHNPAGGVMFLNQMVKQDELRRYFKASDILVSASDFETLGMTVYEGWLCGIKSVVQNAGGFIDQINGPEQGYLVDYEDAAEARLKIEQCLSDDIPIATKSSIGFEQPIEYFIKQSHRPTGMPPVRKTLLAMAESTRYLFVQRDQGTGRPILHPLQHSQMTAN